MGLFDSSLLSRFRSILDSVKSSFTGVISKQKYELKKVREDLQTALYRLDESERKIEELQADNNILKTKVAEIKKSWETFQTIASDASKIQQLIVAFKRIKKELLESRRCCDLNTNIIDDLKRENTRLLRKLEDSSSDCKFDINEIREHVATLKRELSSITIKAEQQEVLIKNLKTREEKLVASIKRNM